MKAILLCLLQVAAAVMIPREDPLTGKLPAGVFPKITMDDKPADPAGKLVKLRYGPFKLPPNSMSAPFAAARNLPKPCEECWIGAFQGGLEYEDGSMANINTGAYLHHFVLSNNGKVDMVCSLKKGVGGTRKQWIYNSGNEYPPVRLNTKYKFGMRVDKNDTFSGVPEFMNASLEEKVVYFTVIFEVIPLDTPGYREATHIRVDLTECGASDVPGKEGAYTYTSQEWVSPYSGVILHNDGHGHPGTVNTELLINDKVYCDSIQYYALRPEWTQASDVKMEGMEMADMKYISDAIACENEGRIEKGDRLVTRTNYNSSLYPQVYFKGELEGQMGINFLYIGRDENTLQDVIPPDPNGIRYPVEMNFTQFSFPRPSSGSTPRPPTSSTPRPPTGSIPRPPTGSIPRPPTGSTPRPPTGSREEDEEEKRPSWSDWESWAEEYEGDEEGSWWDED